MGFDRFGVQQSEMGKGVFGFLISRLAKQPG